VTPPFATASSLAALAGVRHGFFGRVGGISTGIYDSLNAGPGSKDEPAAVAENRRRIAGAFGLGAERLLSLHQVHSPRAVVMDAPWSGPRPEADALVTATPGLAVSALAADCAPVLFADAQAGVVAAAHAGWKGAITGVLEATVAAMTTLGAEPSRIVAAVGPCIQQDSYEVGPEYRDRFVDADPAFARFFRPGAGDRLHFDLPAFCVSRLQQAGVERVESLGHDTAAAPAAYFSHRYNVRNSLGDYGRNCSVIVLSPPPG
jgi:hypothetical protein